MEAVVGLMVLLLGVSHGIETYCDGRQDGAQCYGALGGTVVLQLMEDASEIYKYQWFMNTKKEILNGRNNVIVSNLMGNRSFFSPHNGTFRINDLNRNDGGEYILLIFDSNGHKSQQRTLQLSIQAPVSSVLLVSQCLSQGEKMVSCSSEGGDSPQYSWTLDGQTLKDAELTSGYNETNKIILKQHVSGHLVCSVRNNVSSVSSNKTISTCGFKFINCTLSNATHISKWVFAANNTLCIEPTSAPTTTTNTMGKETDIIASSRVTPTTNITSSNQTSTGPWYSRPDILPIAAGVLSALVILLVVGVAVICSQMRKKNNKPKEEDNEQEITYADVRIMQRQERQIQQTAEVEMEYSQVKFPAQPRQSVVPARDDCVYAQVRRDR